uniref:Uncharacterized protein n=1 Tax=Thermosporothrix sp. COM3 TaxID=2490863 RepID=A0A455SSH0_9CHLR|nr:hypothetical protein KTC_61240 [Thermosporothrix sp. COM3]
MTYGLFTYKYVTNHKEKTKIFLPFSLKESDCQSTLEKRGEVKGLLFRFKGWHDCELKKKKRARDAELQALRCPQGIIKVLSKN